MTPADVTEITSDAKDLIEILRALNCPTGARFTAANAIEDLVGKLAAQTARAEAAEARADDAIGELSALSSLYGAGLGDDKTTAAEFVARIKWGVDFILNAEANRRKAAGAAGGRTDRRAGIAGGGFHDNGRVCDMTAPNVYEFCDPEKYSDTQGDGGPVLDWPGFEGRVVRYIRADAPELVALVAAVKAEIEARNIFLSTAPDRGGSHGPKGQRKMALENAQLATVLAVKAYEALQ